MESFRPTATLSSQASVSINHLQVVNIFTGPHKLTSLHFQDNKFTDLN